MKTILGFVLFVLCVSVTNAQLAVRTETASNQYVNHSALTTGDTVFTTATSIATGSLIRHYGISGALVGVLVGTPIASDTIIIKNGLGTVVQIVLAASGQLPTYFPCPARLDTSLIYIQKKGSNTTLIFRTRY